MAFERIVANVTIEELSQRCGLETEALEELESGDQDLSVVELSEVLDGYFELIGLETATGVAVDVDLDGGTVALAAPRRKRRVSNPPADRNLIRYLELVHRAWESAPGDPISIADVDLSILRGALALRQKGLERHMGQNAGVQRLPLAWPIGAMVVLLLASGAIIVGAGTWPATRQGQGEVTEAPQPSVSTAPSPVESSPTAPLGEPRIGTAVSIEREELARLVAAESEPRIGTPLVVERHPGDDLNP